MPRGASFPRPHIVALEIQGRYQITRAVGTGEGPFEANGWS